MTPVIRLWKVLKAWGKIVCTSKRIHLKTNIKYIVCSCNPGYVSVEYRFLQLNKKISPNAGIFVYTQKELKIEVNIMFYRSYFKQHVAKRLSDLKGIRTIFFFC